MSTTSESSSPTASAADDVSHDLIIVGTGSGNSIPGPEFDDWDVAIVERGVFGGTCLNVGCIPSKMFVYAADIATHVEHAEKYGLDVSLNGVDWPSIVNRVFGERIDPIAAGGEKYRVEECDNITVYQESARFVGPGRLQVGDKVITAPNIVLGAGGRPFTPAFPGVDDLTVHTSDSVMRLPELPARMAVIGAGYIGAEMGHVFGSLGTDVTLLVRSGAMLRNEDDEVSARATEMYGERFDLRLNTTIVSGRQDGDEIVLTLNGPDGESELRVDVLLSAAGRVPNSDQLNVEAAGIETHPNGKVKIDGFMATNVEGVWAFGDLANNYDLKHVANAEVKVLAHNLLHPEDRREIDYGHVPHAVFGWPQIAGVGLTERAARDEGRNILIAKKDYGAVAYGWAMEDDTSFGKLVVDADTRLLLGAHIIGPQSSTMIQQLIQGMRFGQTVDEMAHDQMYIHPALSELVENLLLEVPDSPR